MGVRCPLLTHTEGHDGGRLRWPADTLAPRSRRFAMHARPHPGRLLGGAAIRSIEKAGCSGVGDPRTKRPQAAETDVRTCSLPRRAQGRLPESRMATLTVRDTGLSYTAARITAMRESWPCPSSASSRHRRLSCSGMATRRPIFMPRWGEVEITVEDREPAFVRRLKFPPLSAMCSNGVNCAKHELMDDRDLAADRCPNLTQPLGDRMIHMPRRISATTLAVSFGNGCSEVLQTSTEVLDLGGYSSHCEDTDPILARVTVHSQCTVVSAEPGPDPGTRCVLLKAFKG